VPGRQSLAIPADGRGQGHAAQAHAPGDGADPGRGPRERRPRVGTRPEADRRDRGADRGRAARGGEAMKAIDTIRWALQKTDAWPTGAAEDLRDPPLVQPTPRGGNHPLWVIGHLAVVEGSVPQILFGEPNPVEHWRPLFGQGSTPTTDAAA